MNTDFTPDVPANSYKKHKILRRTLALKYNQRIENLKRLFTITCLGISKGDFVTVKVEGNDEAEAANVLENYFKENL